MSKFNDTRAFSLVISGLALAVLAACGGGGGDGGGSSTATSPGTVVSVGGTVAKGAVLAGATVSLTCANGETLSGLTTSAGTYTAPAKPVIYPCIGQATLGALAFRGILLAGGTANFTPLTDMLVATVLAAASSGSSSLSLSEFLNKIQTDSTFATSVTSPTAVNNYKQAVLAVVKAQLIASGKTAADADAILSAGGNFDSAPFVQGSALDLVLDNTASVLQNADGSVKASVQAAATASGNTLPTPNAGATGGTGSTSRVGT